MSTSSLCEQCREQRFGQLKGVARRRADTWIEDLVRKVRCRDQPWPATSPLMRRMATLHVVDLTRDPQLLEQLAAECANWAERRWTELRRPREMGEAS